MPSVTVTLAISHQQYARFYRGHASEVICTAKDGRKIQLPAGVLRKFLTHEGIYGEFLIRFSSKNKFIDITKA